MNFTRRGSLASFVSCVTIGIDLATKAIIRETLGGSLPQYYLDGMLRLSHWENAGTFMSLGDQLPGTTRFWIFTAGIGAFAIGLIVWLCIKPSLRPVDVIAGSLIGGGTLSNVIDRLLNDGRVLDFINIVMTPLHLMIFNLADVAIALGAAILLYLIPRRLIAL